MNERIAELRDALNARPMKKYGNKSRNDLFAELDQPALRLLPGRRFVYADWKTVRVNIDYHVAVDGHFYSVPFKLAHEQLDARIAAMSVELFRRGIRVAAHPRSRNQGGHTTLTEHMPRAHREHAEWTPTRLLGWASSIGPNTRDLVTAILQERPHPEQGFRSCLGIFRLGKRYGNERLDAACKRAHDAGARSYRHVDSILKHGLDRAPDIDENADAGPTTEPHINVRGPDYYKEN